MLTRIQYKERVHRKYDCILYDLKSNYKIAMVSPTLLKGIDDCLKINSDLPYFDKFYSDYFCVYNIDESTLKSRLPDHYLLTQHYLTLYCSLTFCTLENILYLYT